MTLAIQPDKDVLNKALVSLRDYLKAREKLSSISVYHFIDAWVVLESGISCSITAVREDLEVPGPESTVTIELKLALLYPEPAEGEAYMRAIAGLTIAELRSVRGLEIQGVAVSSVEYGRFESDDERMLHTCVIAVNLLILRE